MIYHAEMEGRVVKQWFVMGSACRFMALAGLLCLALLLSGCGTTYISAPDYGGRYDTSSLGARVAQTARSQIGAHYRLGGTTPKGFDCSGLIWWAYRQHGINVPRVTDAQAKAGYGVGRGIAMRPGDILVFDTNRGRTGLHTALYTGNGRFVHSPTSGKRVREDSFCLLYTSPSPRDCS